MIFGKGSRSPYPRFLNGSFDKCKGGESFLLNNAKSSHTTCPAAKTSASLVSICVTTRLKKTSAPKRLQAEQGLVYGNFTTTVIVLWDANLVKEYLSKQHVTRGIAQARNIYQQGAMIARA